MPTCGSCDAEFHTLQIVTKVVHDGRGSYYLARNCPACDATNDRIIPTGDMEIRDVFKEDAERDTLPPPPAAFEEGGEARGR